MNEDKVTDLVLGLVDLMIIVMATVLLCLCLFTAPWWINVWFDPLMIAGGGLGFVMLYSI